MKKFMLLTSWTNRDNDRWVDYELFDGIEEARERREKHYSDSQHSSTKCEHGVILKVKVVD